MKKHSKYKNSIFFEFIQTYGISQSSAIKMCKKIRVSPYKPSNLITDDKKDRAFKYIKSKQMITFDLKDQKLQKFVSLYSIRHYKGLRHRFFLTMNGQRTCTNGVTAHKEAKKYKPLVKKRLKQLNK